MRTFGRAATRGSSLPLWPRKIRSRIFGEKPPPRVCSGHTLCTSARIGIDGQRSCDETSTISLQQGLSTDNKAPHDTTAVATDKPFAAAGLAWPSGGGCPRVFAGVLRPRNGRAPRLDRDGMASRHDLDARFRGGREQPAPAAIFNRDGRHGGGPGDRVVPACLRLRRVFRLYARLQRRAGLVRDRWGVGLPGFGRCGHLPVGIRPSKTLQRPLSGCRRVLPGFFLLRVDDLPII